MKILVTNDDGISSPGLWAAVEALRPHGEVHVVAPDREQSGVGASLTLHVPIRATPVTPRVNGDADGIRAYSVEGTPADSCVLALENLVGKVDLVVSGINMGSNLASDILVSGTMGAALHGYMRGFASIAISVSAVRDTRFDVAAALLSAMVERLWSQEVPRPFLLNVNVPNQAPEAIKGIEISRLARRNYTESVKEGDDGRRKYYWISRNRSASEGVGESTDACAVRNNRISITPLDFDLTETGRLPEFGEAFGGMFDQLHGHQS